MPNKKCVSCGRDIAAHAVRCPYCKADQPMSSMPTKHAEGASTLSPGWYERDGHHNTLTYYDGEHFTNKVAPARVKLDLGRLVQGVALGVVAASCLSGFVFYLLSR